MYFITCLQYPGTEIVDGKPRYGAQRTFGFEETYEEAEQDLNENYCDMYECLYSYAVIEKIEEGRFIDKEFKEEDQHWFEYDRKKDGFFKIDKPNGNHETQFFVCS